MEEVRGEKIVIRFDGHKCIHARQCVTGAPDTFRANVEGPWIHPDATPVDRLVEVAHRCPSGAITYERLDGARSETPPPVNLITIRENGPLAINADIVIAGEAAGVRATLCRCGASKRKPYCDGSHVAAGFQASGEPPTKTADALAARDGAVSFTPIKDGPLMAEGNLEICSGTGRIVERTTKTWLCRCGASQNKPFCDGSHKAAGFTG